MKRIAILLSTYNGEKWIIEQINSILNQTGVDVTIFVRDDGSSDNTVEIIKKLQNENDNIILINDGDYLNWGVKGSFTKLLNYARKYKIKYDFYAFSDQDDVWLENKLIRAVNMIGNYNDEILYFSSKTIVDSQLKELGKVDSIKYLNPILHSLDNSNAFGCTFVFNYKLLTAICDAKCGIHDSWMFRSAVWCGFKIITDEHSEILYRQHGDNVVGAKNNKSNLKKLLSVDTWKNQIDRFRCINLDTQIIMHKEIYDTYSDTYYNENMDILKLVVNYRYSFRDRISLMKQRIFRENGWKDNIKWQFRILTNRI